MRGPNFIVRYYRETVWDYWVSTESSVYMRICFKIWLSSKERKIS